MKAEGSPDGNPIIFKEVEGAGGYSYAMGIGLSNSGRAQGFIEPVEGEEAGVGGGQVEEGVWTHIASTAPLPVVESGEEYEPEESNILITGIVDPRGLKTAVTYEYGLSKSYGSKWPESVAEQEKWVTGRTPREVEQDIEGLEPESTYHYRVVATNALGKVVGPDQTATTSAPEPKPLLAGDHLSGLVGVQYSGRGNAYGESELQKVVESGAKIYRAVIGEGVTAEQKEAQRKINDQLFTYLTGHGIRILPDVVGIPGGRFGNQLPSIDPGTPQGKEHRKLWSQGLRALARRYGPGGEFWKESGLEESYAPSFWEIWNEENVEPTADASGEIDPKRYGELLELSHDVLEEVNSESKVSRENKVLFGAVLTVGKTVEKGPNHPENEMTTGEFIRETGHFNDYDALSLHPYAFKASSISVMTGKVKTNIRAARKVLNHHSGKKKQIWITEIGWPVEAGDPKHPAVSETVQAERLVSVFNMIKENAGTGPGEFNIQNLFWYNIKDPGGPKWDGHCGLFKDNDEPRIALPSFQEEAK